MQTNRIGNPQAEVQQENDTDPAAAQMSLKQAKLVAALLAGPDVQTAARTAGVGCSTVHRWLKLPAFQEALARQRDALMHESLASVKNHTGRAVSQLAALLDTPDDRLRRLVCNDILQHALRVHELQEIEHRLAALETRLDDQQKGMRK